MDEKIREIITSQINPQLELHAGGCEFVSFSDGILTIRLFGGCSGCPSSQLTLFNGIVPLLREQVPEIVDVILA